MDFSVIIPVYNCEKYISNAIESVINQTNKSKELIIVNDGSTDNTLNICKKYESEYPFVKVIDKKNSGVSDTRNTGIQNSSGNYIIFLDADDYLSSDALDIYEKVI